MNDKRHQELMDARSLLNELSASVRSSDLSNEFLIGARLRALRREQNQSIRALASRCSISANTLSLIENNRTSPSLHTLQLLANGLGVPLITLFEEDKPEFALVYQQKGQRPVMTFANGTLENLGEGLPPLGAEPILVTLVSNNNDANDISHVGREFIFCLEGKVICTIANQEYTLSPGDSLLFDARAPHHWLNAYPAPSKLLVLFCPMEARDQPAERHLGG
ncbi:MAG: helix-turn-helix transcriptional regulator [Anaerolineales bacterium]|nr:helix-turn-helix transcriptional regulator [Anaerolineales bacterium]